jgi:Arc/MetJ family transcription regulator
MHIVCMKRMNVVLDESLLEEARRVTGDRTYSATIAKALEELVRRAEFRQALERYQTEVSKGGFFRPGYLEELRPNAYSVLKKRSVSAHEKRAPAKKGRGRASHGAR